MMGFFVYLPLLGSPRATRLAHVHVSQCQHQKSVLHINDIFLSAHIKTGVAPDIFSFCDMTFHL